MVLMVKVEAVAAPLGVTEAGEAEHVAFAGRLMQVSETAELNPDNGLTVTVTFVEFPATTVAAVGLMDNPKSPAAPAPPPVPVSRIIWGLLGALSVSVSDPTLSPAVVGVKVTLIAQFEGGVVGWRGAVEQLLA